MKTNQIMNTVERSVGDFGNIIQRTKDGYFNANSIIDIINNYRNSIGLCKIPGTPTYLQNDEHKRFVNSLKEHEGKEVWIKGKGGRVHSPAWVHPLIMVDMLMWQSPEFKITVLKWVADNLIDLRIKGGDSYNELTEAIKLKLGDELNKEVPNKTYIILALKIKRACGVEDWNTATKQQLELRDRIQRGIISVVKYGYGASLNDITDKVIAGELNYLSIKK